MKIAVVGNGYVSFVSAACLAEMGFSVHCVNDGRSAGIEDFQEAYLSCYEEGLEDLVKKNKAHGRLAFFGELSSGLAGCELIFIASEYEAGSDDGIDYQYVLALARKIGQELRENTLLVTLSTLPVGTTMKVKAAILDELEKRGVQLQLELAAAPHFLREGRAVRDFLNPSRILVGADSQQAKQVLRKVFQTVVEDEAQIIDMDIVSAELCKYASNGFLACKLSYMSDIASLCERLGADIGAISSGMGADPRIGKAFLNPGIGYGGIHFPQEVRTLCHIGDMYGHHMHLLETAEEVNEKQKYILVDKVKKHFGGNLNGKTLAVWGLTFNPNINIVEGSPALVVVDELVKAGAQVKAFDPSAGEQAAVYFEGKEEVELCSDQYDVLIDADALLVLTAWNEFKIFNYKVAELLLRNKLVFDGRNIFNPAEMKSQGYEYYGVGRGVK